MGLVLKGIEIDNFKSYTEKQTIYFSDLSVLLGANSSGKSTALQALLVIKQTMECNSPDEELLLSGKYVALGDFDDVISDNSKEGFSFTALLGQTEMTENVLDNDTFAVSWFFKRGTDGTSAILDKLNINFENISMEFRRDNNGSHILYINNRRSPYSAIINNLLLSEYYISYDEHLNAKAAGLLNELLESLVGGKHTKIATDRPVALYGISEFYYKLLDNLQNNPAEITISENSDMIKSAQSIYDLIRGYGNALVPRYEAISRDFPKDLLVQLLMLAIAKSQNEDILNNAMKSYADFLKKYDSKIEDYLSKSSLGSNPFINFDRYEDKEDNLTQLKYSLDFYQDFHKNIISKIFFVGPIRETPQGLYNIGFEAIPKYVGPTGAYFASVLLHENKKIKNYILPGGMIEKCTLSDALAAWMVHLNIASAVSVDKKNSFGFSVSIENMEQVKSDIMNVGIGTSQVLPVLISVLLSEPNEILVFEQPELHLHPYSQSRLADMFTEFCKHGRKVLLETHSEYFLLRLRYHIVKEKYSQNATAVNFFHNEAGTKVEKANISGFGNIEYPVDFHDETQELLNEILEAALERKGLS